MGSSTPTSSGVPFFTAIQRLASSIALYCGVAITVAGHESGTTARPPILATSGTVTPSYLCRVLAQGAYSSISTLTAFTGAYTILPKDQTRGLPQHISVAIGKSGFR